MHGEAADKPRYSFNFRVGLGEKRESGETEGREGKKGRGGLMKRANVAPGEEAGGGERSF